MAEIFQNREQNYQHVGISIAEHHMRFCGIAGALERPIVGVQHRSVWQGLNSSKIAAVCSVSHSQWIVFFFSCDVHCSNGNSKYLTDKFDSYIT